MSVWDFELNRRESSNLAMEKPHFHESYEIMVPLTCGGTIFVDRWAWTLRRGLIFVLDDSAPHRCFSRENISYSRYILHFSRDMLAMLDCDLMAERLAGGGSRYLAPSPDDFAQCLDFLKRMELPGDDMPSCLHRRAAFLGLLAIVNRMWTDEPAYVPYEKPADTVAAAAIEYIRTHLSQPISLDELAVHCFISKSTLCHRFKEATGFSVGEYIIHCRILRAKTLLRRGHSVQATGELAGFGDNAHFIRTFKRMVGISPGQYGKNYRSEVTPQ